MTFSMLTENLSVAGQLNESDLEQVAQRGIRTLINNRPDGEGGASQPMSAVLEAKARELGLSYHYLPLPAGQAPDASLLEAFANIYNSSEKPVLAFCRTGNRSGHIFMAARPLLND